MINCMRINESVIGEMIRLGVKKKIVERHEDESDAMTGDSDKGMSDKAAKNLKDSYDNYFTRGKKAKEKGESNKPPFHLTGENKKEWLEGYNSVKESEDEMDDRESEMVHISKIRPDDVVRHNGKTLTVGNKDIKHGGFMGSTLFGDSYKLGKDKVERVLVNKKKSVKESEDEGSKEENDASGKGVDDFKAGKDCKPPSSYSEKQKAAYREGYKYAEDRDSTKRANDANHEMNENEDHENGKDEKKYRVGGHKKKFTLKDAKQKAEEIRKKTGIIVSVEKIDESEDHDEEKETQEDPTREKLETAKDEADEKKGGPAELAADLRVSVRIEKMGIGRYKRMLTKHELSSDDEEWLKKRIQDLEDCVKAMEAKIPDLEKEAEGKDIKESMIKGIRQAIFELAKG